MDEALRPYAAAALSFVAAMAVFLLARRALLARAQAWAARTSSKLDDVLVAAVASIRAWEYGFVALYFCLKPLKLPAPAAASLRTALIVLLTFRVVRLLQLAAGYGLGRLADGATDAENAWVLKNARGIVSFALWACAAVFILDNLGIDISAAVAGLGIGGIAVAMASQHILGDLFSSMVIYTDKPFAIGDAIVVGDFTGTVEHVGIKTTRLRSVSGELIVMANSDLTSSRIRNFQRMRERRVVLAFGLVCETPPEKVRRAVEIVKECVVAAGRTRFDRSHLKGIGPSSLDLEAVYFLQSADYNVHMDVQQSILLESLQRFGREGIALAYPTQTVYLERAG